MNKSSFKNIVAVSKIKHQFWLSFMIIIIVGYLFWDDLLAQIPFQTFVAFIEYHHSLSINVYHTSNVVSSFNVFFILLMFWHILNTCKILDAQMMLE